MAKVQIPFNGQPRDAESVEISQASEHWSEYLLDDGTVIKIKTLATSIYRLTDMFDNVGNPVYNVIFSNPIVSVDAPQELRKPLL